MKVRLAVTLAFLAAFAFAGRIDIGADFDGSGALPPAWEFRTHESFRPLPASSIVADEDGGGFLRIGEVVAKAGTALGPKTRFPAQEGDTLTVDLLARGKGVITVSFARYTQAGRWAWRTPEESGRLAADWRPFSFEIPVKNSPVGVVASMQFWLGAKAGTCADVRAISVRRRRSSFPAAGDYIVVEKLSCDSFETPGRRSGEPEIVQGDLSPGVPRIVRRGRYRFTRPCRAILPVKRFSLPPADDRETFFVFGARVYGLDAAEGSFIFGVNSERVARIPFPQLPKAKLPADVVYAVDRDGSCTMTTRSLADATVVRTCGYEPFFDGLSEPFVAAVNFVPRQGAAGTAEIDELHAGYAKNAVPEPFPYKAEPPPEFDPVKERWPLVFSDDFTGEKIDSGKWFIPPWRKKNADLARLDGKGNLVVAAEPDPANEGLLRTTAVWTRRAFRYGYFEARLKFTFKPGWWAAFWLYGISDRNPFLDGFEIDLFEDYPSRDGAPVISHNLHNNVPVEASKSWGMHSAIPAPVDGYHVFGCRWTPFEIAEYIDGRLIRSRPRNAGEAGGPVLFRGLDTVVGTVPLHVIFSGTVSKSSRGKIDFSRFSYPDEFVVDWVKVYGWPDDGKGPQIAWKGVREVRRVAPGETLTFALSAGASPSGAKVKNVYLFDNGYPIAFKSAPPWAFEVPFSREHYGTTQYMVPGRSGATPPFDGYVHAFVAFAEDEKGVLSFTPPVLRVPSSVSGIKPWKGDRLGLVRSADCFRYEYDAGRGGTRTLSLEYGASPELRFDNRCHVLLDGERAAELKLPCSDNPVEVVSAKIRFPPGRHELMFVPVGIFTVYGLEMK